MKIWLLPLIASLVLACGGGDSDVLHLAGQDITEDNYRTYLRQSGRPGMNAVCDLIEGLDKESAARVLQNASRGASPVVWPGATPKPGQADDSDDYVTATGILQDECKR